MSNKHQDILFPNKHREYKIQYLGKMRYEDVLSNEDGVQPVPLQLENTFNSKNQWSDGWKNMVFFGDNLQLLKTIYKNEDPLIKDKIKGKIKLIYIDPPFATQDEFISRNGVKAYSDKKKGSDFIEFLRRRLILAKEVLADDGSIFIHLDQKMSHYIKVIMDEVFGKHNFRNEIIWSYDFGGRSKNFWASKHDNLLFYSKSNSWIFNLDTIDRIAYKGNLHKYRGGIKSEGKLPTDVWNIPIINKMSKELSDYPTQKPEELLERIIKTHTNEGDIVLDFFGGSGATAITSEKLNRKWVTCDIGKYSYLITQKRLIEIKNSNALLEKEKIETKKYKNINNNIILKKEKGKGSREEYDLKDFIDINKIKEVFGDNVELSEVAIQQGMEIKNRYNKYGKEYKSFITAQLGNYDLDKIFDMDFESYKQFCSHLFNFKLRAIDINGTIVDGVKNDAFVEIFPYQDYKDKDVRIDMNYIQTLHDELSDYIKDKYYIITPESYISFKEDYVEIDKIKYYFLRIPYHMIEELHKAEFERTNSPISKENLNDVNYAIGFHFKIPPEIKREIIKTKEGIQLKISSFIKMENNPNKINTFKNLSSIYIDKNYKENFILSESYFSKDLEIVDNNIVLDIKDINENVFIIYSDINGNEAKELIKIKDL